MGNLQGVTVIKNIDRATCALLRAKLDTVLVKLSEELGMNVRSTSGNFTDSNFTIKVRADLFKS